MAFNPMKLMKLKDTFRMLNREHPKVLPFLRAVKDQALEEGTVMEISVTKPDGTNLTSNIRLTADDVRAIKEFL